MQKQKQKQLQLYSKSHNQILCVCALVHVNMCMWKCIKVAQWTKREGDRADWADSRVPGWLTVCLSVQLSICPTVALCALICGHKA